MIKKLLLLLCCLSLHANHGFISSPGIGLYVDVTYMPTWRNGFNQTDVIIRDSTLATSGICTSGADDPAIFTSGIHGCYTLTDQAFSMNQCTNLYSPTLKISAEISADRESSLQGSYFGMYDLRCSAKVSDNGNFIGYCVNPYQDVYATYFLVEDTFKEFLEIDVIYNESYDSAEFNYLNHLTPRYYDYMSVSVLAGLRGIRYINDIKLIGHPPIFLIGENPTDIPATLYLKNNNTFLGGQIGADFRYRVSDNVYFYIPAKVGFYGNIIDYMVNLRFPMPITGGAHYPEELAYVFNAKLKYGYTADLSPRFEIHVGALYLCLGGYVSYLKGTSPTYRQIAQCNLNQPVISGEFILYGVTIGGGLHF